MDFSSEFISLKLFDFLLALYLLQYGYFELARLCGVFVNQSLPFLRPLAAGDVNQKRLPDGIIKDTVHTFFYKNKLYKNTQAEICPKIKNKLRKITRLKFWSEKFKKFI